MRSRPFKGCQSSRSTIKVSFFPVWRSKRNNRGGFRMFREADTALSVRPWRDWVGLKLFWSKVSQSTVDPEFVTVCLLSTVGLLISLCLAVLFNLPAAESLLQMPG